MLEYKLSKYNHTIEKDNRVVLFNTYTGALSILSLEEFNLYLHPEQADEINKYTKLFIDNGYWIHYLRDEFTEIKINNLIATYEDSEKYSFIIAPTLKCNANCFYCYESTYYKHHINEKTVAQLSLFFNTFLKKGKKLHFTWFGGEPLLCENQISKITSSLYSKDFTSSLITNG